MSSIIETNTEIALELINLKAQDQWVQEYVSYNKNNKKITATALAELANEYWKASEHIRVVKFDQVRRTFFEHKIIDFLQSQTKLTYYTSFWYGPYVLDAFIPGLKSNDRKGFRGIAIEVDGGIHNHPSKMLKDELKYEFLKKNKIIVLSFNNQFSLDKTTKGTLHNIAEIARLDTRGKQRVLRRAYSVTLSWYYYAKNLRSEDIQLKKDLGV